MSAEKLKVEVEVCKEVYELGKAVESTMKAYKLAVADGFQAGQDIPAVLLSCLQDYFKALDGVQKLGEEFRESLGASLNGLTIPLFNGLDLLLKK